MILNALSYLLESLFSFVSFLLLLRFFMIAYRVPFTNPIGAIVIALTQGIVRFTRRLIPSLWGLDLGSLIPAIGLKILFFIVYFFFLQGASPDIPAATLLLAAFASGLLASVSLILWIHIMLLVAEAILSWVNPAAPIAPVIQQFNYPLLKHIRRFIPPINGIDLSILFALLVLQLLLFLL